MPNSQATSAARLQLYESAIPVRFKFSREIQTIATFDFFNSIRQKRPPATVHLNNDAIRRPFVESLYQETLL